jgi:hypothetical protein
MTGDGLGEWENTEVGNENSWAGLVSKRRVQSIRGKPATWSIWSKIDVDVKPSTTSLTLSLMLRMPSMLDRILTTFKRINRHSIEFILATMLNRVLIDVHLLVLNGSPEWQ